MIGLGNLLQNRTILFHGLGVLFRPLISLSQPENDHGIVRLDLQGHLISRDSPAPVLQTGPSQCRVGQCLSIARVGLEDPGGNPDRLLILAEIQIALRQTGKNRAVVRFQSQYLQILSNGLPGHTGIDIKGSKHLADRRHPPGSRQSPV